MSLCDLSLIHPLHPFNLFIHPSTYPSTRPLVPGTTKGRRTPRVCFASLACPSFPSATTTQRIRAISITRHSARGNRTIPSIFTRTTINRDPCDVVKVVQREREMCGEREPWGRRQAGWKAWAHTYLPCALCSRAVKGSLLRPSGGAEDRIRKETMRGVSGCITATDAGFLEKPSKKVVTAVGEGSW